VRPRRAMAREMTRRRRLFIAAREGVEESENRARESISQWERERGIQGNM